MPSSLATSGDEGAVVAQVVLLDVPGDRAGERSSSAPVTRSCRARRRNSLPLSVM